MQLEESLKKLSDVKKELRNLGHDITVGRLFVYDVDDVRIAYLNTEIDTLLFILESLRMRKYKEALIMLRSTFEKFLYYWLMLSGKKYKWTIYYHIEKQSSNIKTIKEIRDETHDKWLKEKGLGNQAFQNATEIRMGKHDDEIIVNYEFEGVYGDDGEVVPMYHFILKSLDPDIVHLLKNKNSTAIFLNVDQGYPKIQVHKEIYHRFLYIESIIKNLSLNSLITDFTKNQILVHYNFLSKFVHPTNESIVMYQHLNHEVQVYGGYREDILADLILLYVSKLMHLYVKNFVNAYRLNHDTLTSPRYDAIINELDQMSKDLWFLDNQPTDEDLRWSDAINHGYYRGIKVTDPDTNLLYYTDPFERMRRLRGAS